MCMSFSCQVVSVFKLLMFMWITWDLELPRITLELPGIYYVSLGSGITADLCGLLELPGIYYVSLGAGITAAAGTRPALQSILVKGC